MNSDQEPSILTKVLIHKTHGGRKKDSKFWQREVENSRNDFVGYNNGEIPIDQSGAGDTETSKLIKKVKRVAIVVGIVALCCLFSFVYLRPDLFPFLTYSKIYQTFSELLPDEAKEGDPVKLAPAEKSNDLSTQPREYSFSQEQILKAKKDVLEAQKDKSNSIGKGTPRAYSSVKSFKDRKNRYEIQLLSGRYVYADSVIVTKETVTFENKKGLAVSVNRDEIKSLKKVK